MPGTSARMYTRAFVLLTISIRPTFPLSSSRAGSRRTSPRAPPTASAAATRTASPPRAPPSPPAPASRRTSRRAAVAVVARAAARRRRPSRRPKSRRPSPTPCRALVARRPDALPEPAPTPPASSSASSARRSAAKPVAALRTLSPLSRAGAPVSSSGVAADGRGEQLRVAQLLWRPEKWPPPRERRSAQAPEHGARRYLQRKRRHFRAPRAVGARKRARRGSTEQADIDVDLSWWRSLRLRTSCSYAVVAAPHRPHYVFIHHYLHCRSPAAARVDQAPAGLIEAPKAPRTRRRRWCRRRRDAVPAHARRAFGCTSSSSL